MAKVEQITTGWLGVWAKHYPVKELVVWEQICKTTVHPEPNPLILFSEVMMGKRKCTSAEVLAAKALLDARCHEIDEVTAPLLYQLLEQEQSLQ